MAARCEDERRGRPGAGVVGRAARIAGVIVLVAVAAVWGGRGPTYAAARGTLCGPAAGGGSAVGPDDGARLDVRRALWLVRRVTGDVPACTDGATSGVTTSGVTTSGVPASGGAARAGAADGPARPPAWASLDWAVVRPLSDDDACSALRPACGPAALPRTRVVLAGPSGLQAVLVDADGRVTEDAVDPGRDAPPAVPSIDRPAPRAVVRAPLVVRGLATGDWYFEGDLPVSVVDATGQAIARGVAVAQGAWMTSDPVPFEATFEALPRTGFPPLALILERDDPSDIPWHGGALVVPLAAVAR